uniref:C-type lectin domain-containing protein n=1 Tax=Sparus aurata TaxID=8175 RepID=A0A671UBJ0_SPAAU
MLLLLFFQPFLYIYVGLCVYVYMYIYRYVSVRMCIYIGVCMSIVSAALRFKLFKFVLTVNMKCFVALDSSLCCNLFKAESCHKCQEGWERNGPQCYYFSTDKLTWEQARDECQQNGADLVKIESEDEHKMVEKEDKFWIGLTDSVTEDTCLTFWRKGEPNDWTGEDVDGQDCVRMGTKSGSGLKWWFDKSCKASQKSICEKSA